MSINNVDKILEAKSDLKEKDNLIKLAKDQEDIIFDIESEIVDILTEDYRKEREPGQSFLDWLDTKPKDYFLTRPLGMKDGGEVISISQFLKQKEKPRIKRINLDSVAPGKAIANLTEAEREAVRNLLKLTFGGND